MRPAFYVSLNIYFVNRNVSFSRLWLGGEERRGLGRSRGAGPGVLSGGAPTWGGLGAAAVRDRGRPPGAAGEGRVRAGTGAPPRARRPPGRAVPRCPDGAAAAAGAVRGSAPRPEKPRGRRCAPLKAFGCRAGHGNCSGPLRSVLEPLRPAGGPRRGLPTARGRGPGARRPPLPGEPGLCIQISLGLAAGGKRGGFIVIFFFFLSCVLINLLFLLRWVKGADPLIIRAVSICARKMSVK